jgi:hypothetical protein
MRARRLNLQMMSDENRHPEHRRIANLRNQIHYLQMEAGQYRIRLAGETMSESDLPNESHIEKSMD